MPAPAQCEVSTNIAHRAKVRGRLELTLIDLARPEDDVLNRSTDQLDCSRIAGGKT